MELRVAAMDSKIQREIEKLVQKTNRQSGLDQTGVSQGTAANTYLQQKWISS